MKKILFLLLLITTYLSASASVIDSLTTALNEPGVNKSKIYILLAQEYINFSPEKSIENAKLAIEHAPNIEDRVDYKNQLGVAFEYSGRYQEALNEYNSALLLAESNSYEKGTGVSFLNIAIAKTQLSDYAVALEYALKAITIFKSLNAKDLLTSSYNNLGNIYLSLEDFSQALHYYEIVLQSRQGTDDEVGIAKILHNIALVHIASEDYDKATEFLEQALKSMRLIDDKYGMAFCYTNLSNIYLLEEKYVESNNYNFLALKIFEEIGNPEGVAHTCNLLGSTYLILEKYEKAFKYFSKSLVLAKEITLTDLISENYEEFSIYYAAIGDYKQAYKYLELHKSLHDSIYSEEKSKKIATLQSQFEIENKEAKINSLQESRKYQKRINTILVLGLIFGSIVLAFLYFLFKEKIGEIGIRKDTEDRLEASEHKFQQLTENISIAVFTFNMEGKFTYVNPSTSKITGYTQEELLTKQFFDIVHPEDKEKVMSRGFDRIKGEHVVQQYEFKIITKQGVILTLN